MSILKILIIVGLFIITAIFYLPLKDSFIGVPYDYRLKPEYINKNSLYFEREVSCNRIYTREIGLLITPPVSVNSTLDAFSAIKGDVSVSIKQNDITITRDFDLVHTGHNLNSDGIWSKLILRYGPINSIFCNSQNISLKIKNLSFPLKEHEVLIYISRDRRP